MLVVYQLGNADQWGQVFTDGTSQHYVIFLITDKKNNNFAPIILSTCIFVDDERAETIVEAIKLHYSSYGTRLM